MAQELSEKELLKMEVEQLRKEVKNPRSPVSPLFPSLTLFSITSGSSQSWDPKAEGGRWREQHKRQEREVCLWARGGRRGRLALSPAGVPGASPTACPAQRPSEVRPHSPPTACLSPLQPPSPPSPGPVFLHQANRGCPQMNWAGTFVFSQISKTGKEIKDYVEAEAGNDPLLKGIPEDKNPFKEKGGCTLS